jgi:hypothetical protein
LLSHPFDQAGLSPAIGVADPTKEFLAETDERTRAEKVSACLYGAWTQHKMQNQRNHSEYQQQMNEAACHVEYGETAQPSDQQNYK